jgi:CubicO group peptidase (beta-lactamase class C family)
MKPFKRLVASLVLCSIVFAAVTAQQPTRATVTDYTTALAAIEKSLEEKRKELGIPGMSLAIVKDGRRRSRSAITEMLTA